MTKSISDEKYNAICRAILENSGVSFFNIDYKSETVFFSFIDRKGAREKRCMSIEAARKLLEKMMHPDFSLSAGLMRESKDESLSGEMRVLANCDGDGYRWYRVCCNRSYDKNGEVCEISGTMSDIDRIEKKIRNLEKRADSDSMTGLYNRLATEMMINEALMERGGAGAMFMIDIDDFKKVNDTMGHHAGDLLIRAASACIASVFREDDIVGRVGGDEFVAFAPHLLGRDMVEKKARDIVETIRTVNIPGVQTKTCSVGVAVLRGGLHSFEQGFKMADKALYQAKKEGKDGYCVADGEEQ